jgi:hypothetical protein
LPVQSKIGSESPEKSPFQACAPSTDGLTGIWHVPPDEQQQSAMLRASELAGEFQASHISLWGWHSSCSSSRESIGAHPKNNNRN